MSDRGIPWVRILAEGAVIVVSILLAFALDAWWDARRERAELMDDLASVTEEVRTNLDVLALEGRFHGTAVSSIDELVARIDATGDGAWLNLPDTIASSAFVFPPLVDPSTGVLDALVAGGGLSRVRDRRLEQILRNIGPQLEDVVDGEVGARRLATEELVPLFWDAAELESAIGRSGEYRARGLDDTALPTREIRLPNVPGLKNRLLLRRAWVASALRAIERLQADLEEVLVLLDAEMGRARAETPP